MSTRSRKRRRSKRLSAAHEHAPVGFLKAMPGEKGYRAICKACATGVTHDSPLYPVNIRPYKQSCGICKKKIMSGGSVRDLFDGT